MAAKPAVAVETPPPPPKALKPEALDELVKEYLDIEKEIDDAELKLAEDFKAKAERKAELGKQFLELCVAHGSPHEKKSKLLSGLEYEVMTTESSSSSLDQAAIDVLHKKCEKAEKLTLFDKLFERVLAYRMRPGADAVARSSKEGLTGALAAAFLKCTVVKNSPPRLTAVRLREKVA